MTILFPSRNPDTDTGADAAVAARVRAGRAHDAAAMLAAAACGALLVASTAAHAQQPMPSVPHSPENRAVATAPATDPSGSAVHESQAPQAKDAKGAKKGPTAGSKGKPAGAGGFDNGLYGTGAGSNQ